MNYLGLCLIPKKPSIVVLVLVIDNLWARICCANRPRKNCVSVGTFKPSQHRWEVLGNYPVFDVIMVIYHYVETICMILVTPNFLYNMCNHKYILSRWTSSYTYSIMNKYYSGEQLDHYHQKRVRVNYHYFAVM